MNWAPLSDVRLGYTSTGQLLTMVSGTWACTPLTCVLWRVRRPGPAPFQSDLIREMDAVLCAALDRLAAH